MNAAGPRDEGSKKNRWEGQPDGHHAVTPGRGKAVCVAV